MIRFLLGFLILSTAIYLMSRIVPGFKLRTYKSAITVAVVYSLLNWLLFKVFWFITFPLVILKYLTFGIVGVIINAALLMITDKFLDDLEIDGFGSAVFAALGISLVSLLLRAIVF